ncbi:PREDICTED: amyotrophic lateral sclerosis 2 chromosomal region candidate gene 11 protein-like [Branchiostoma belcheri]|uniref:Amyotrophic lateral sclerosis 2 chromosomal region candidate gene 11 protein-like n=1 Tax=Branchiostoma belcheri TaxID=7741 RepID=A0A6P4YKN0_BRABE|nr:PREDICTED: amyotrophic lateral sclerosis 2 chromosomal region candidate gene 11 protein-like [Branchiostoma belcheri]
MPDGKNQDVIVFDDLKHFPIELHRERDHAQNKLCIRAFSWDGSQPEPTAVGTATLHLFDIVKVVGELEVEICFVYGIFGYGQSHQLEQYDQEVKEILNHSMFCRLSPPEQRISKHGHCELLSSLPIGPPSFIPFPTTVDIGNGRDLPKGSCHSLIEQEYPEPTTALAAIKGRRRLAKLTKQLSKLPSGKERTKFLHDLIDEPKMDDPKNKSWAEESFEAATEVMDMADFLRSAPGQSHDKGSEEGEGSVLFSLLRRAWSYTVGRLLRDRESRRVQPAMELQDVPVVTVPDD